MRILHLDSGREMRGGQWQVIYLMRGLSELGHEVRLLARGSGPLLARAREEGFSARGLNPAALLASRSWAEIVHAHDARSHTVAAIAGLSPLIVSRRVAFPVRTGLLSRWKYEQATHYIAISRYVASQLTAAGIKSDSVSVVYDGVPPVAGIWNGPGGALIAPATADPMKGADLAREVAERAGVRLTFSSDLHADLPEAGLFLYLSRSEGLGSAVLLAMAYGCPVVASRSGGLTEAVEDDVTGVLVENRAEAIVAVVEKLLSDEALARRLGEAARERAERCFSVSRMVAGTIQVYRKALNG